jgi:hypothetical protein
MRSAGSLRHPYCTIHNNKINKPNLSYIFEHFVTGFRIYFNDSKTNKKLIKLTLYKLGLTPISSHSATDRESVYPSCPRNPLPLPTAGPCDRTLCPTIAVIEAMGRRGFSCVQFIGKREAIPYRVAQALRVPEG